MRSDALLWDRFHKDYHKRDMKSIAFQEIADDLGIVISEHKLYILDLNETRLSKDIGDSEVNLEGFEIHRKDRNINGGCVAMYVNSSISHNLRFEIDDPLLEVVAIEITLTHTRNFIVICWYRPPTPGNDKDSFAALRKLLSDVDAEGRDNPDR